MLEILDPNSVFFWALIIGVLAGAVAVISRPFSTYVKFVYPNAKFEAIGSPYLHGKNLITLIDNSKNLQDFKETLNNSKDYNIKGESSFEIQKNLDKNLIETVSMMKKDSSKKMYDFYDMYLFNQDIYLLKNVLKKKLKTEKIENDIFEKALTLKGRRLLSEIADTETENISSIIKNHGFSDEVISIFNEEKIDFQKLDIELDKHTHLLLKQVKVPYKCKEGTQRFIKYLTDIKNIKNILRAKQMGFKYETCKTLFLGEGQEIASWKFDELCEQEGVAQVITSIEGTSFYDILKNNIEKYNEEKSVQVLENALDVHFLKIIRELSSMNYVTIGPSIRFLVSKNFEIQNLKIIAKGIDEKIPSGIIKDIIIMEDSL